MLALQVAVSHTQGSRCCCCCCLQVAAESIGVPVYIHAGGAGGWIVYSARLLLLLLLLCVQVAAESIGVPVTSMLAVQVAGSCAGKMMCMSNILVSY
jgi:hypothetical protein